jgi:hypothetical protein
VEENFMGKFCVIKFQEGCLDTRHSAFIKAEQSKLSPPALSKKKTKTNPATQTRGVNVWTKFGQSLSRSKLSQFVLTPPYLADKQ